VSRAYSSARLVIVGDRDIAKFRGWLMRDLVSAGHEVLACAPNQPGLPESIAATGAKFLPMSIDRTGTNPIRDLMGVIALSRLLRSLRAQVVLSHGTKANILAPLATRLVRGCRAYAMLEGLGYAFSPGSEFTRQMLRAVLVSLFRVAFRCCSGVFVLNDHDLQYVHTARLVGASQEVTKVNGTGIDLNEFSYSPPEASQPRFLLIARLLREKGILEYLEAARILRPLFPNAHFQLLGPLDTNPGAFDSDQVAAWQKEGLIEYLGEANDVRPILRSCTVYVLPSYREGMPRTILEALAIGRPIVTTDVPGCQETVVDGFNGFLVPARNSSALAQAMQRFLDHPQLIYEMGKNSRTLAETRFDVRQVNATVMAAMGLAGR
jgi:glycosyltransferase involved in cell wall biosynthesis